MIYSWIISFINISSHCYILIHIPHFWQVLISTLQFLELHHFTICKFHLTSCLLELMNLIRDNLSLFRFISFVAQYEAVSYGDSLFSSFLVLPLQQRYDNMFRKTVWNEHTGIFRSFSLSFDQVKCCQVEYR